ncbi:MAG: hypothetical protein CM15mP83_0370 [Flavobacteriaceae bacterium]|nr:MAG: hypothetical protein CM15mP83_0370 [Flavobacteriaceae bacterium]
MELKEIQNLIKFVAKSGVNEVHVEMGETKVTIKTGGDVVQQVVTAPAIEVATPVSPVGSAPATAAEPAPLRRQLRQKKTIITSQLNHRLLEPFIANHPLINLIL